MKKIGMISVFLAGSISYSFDTTHLQSLLDSKVCPANANLVGALLTGGSFVGVDFSNADLRGAYLDECDLSGAIFSAADLTGAHFEKSNLSGVNFSGAIVRGAIFEDADLSGALWVDGSTCLAGSIGECVLTSTAL
jgi:uncharacterized protein YjbI with pentapeptide repeats